MIAVYIGYDINNGIKYAKLCVSKRVDGKVKTFQKNLGRVIDEEKKIYKSRERGIFTYDLETDTYSVPDKDEECVKNAMPQTEEKLILDFGDSYFLSNFIKESGIDKAIEAMGYSNNDSLYAIIMFYILCSMANCHAEEWYEGNYCRCLFPDADLRSQRISDMLEQIGTENCYRKFFEEYLKMFAKSKDGENILIDSTGLPNSIHFPLTAISNHNGKISNEVRLIYVLQQGTNIPLFFRYCPGNVIDVSTLTKTILELKAHNVDTNFATLDAGYLTEENVRELFDAKISFLSRLRENTSLYKRVVEEHLSTLESKENIISFNGRYIYLKKIKENYWGHNVYVYLGRDLNMQSVESSKLYESADKKKLTPAQVHNARQSQGIFVLVSSRSIEVNDVMQKYYMRTNIEQMFDICKNYTNMLPLRVQKEETFRGHLMLSFISSVIVKLIQSKLSNSKYTPQSAFLNLRNHKCKVFDDYVLTMESAKRANDIYKFFGIMPPHLLMRN